MTLGPIRRRTSPHAARLRRDRTECEERFWLAVRDRRLGEFKFRFQHSVFPRVADFACLDAGVIVEIDGSQHAEEKDRRRTELLEARGFAVLRFWNCDILTNLDGVLEVVLAACRARSVKQNRY